MDNTSSWKFSQCFGDKSENASVLEADMISALSFDQTGEFLASGDRAGRIVLFNRNYSKQGCEYKFNVEFQSHEPEFDYLKSLEINEKINKIAWCRRSPDGHTLLSTNDRTIKMWRIREYDSLQVVENNGSLARKLLHTDVRIPIVLPKLSVREHVVAAYPKKIFSAAHAYHINSVSMNSDGEMFLSSDDLRINIWDLNGRSDSSFNIVDIKPATIEELSEVITTAAFHPSLGHLFAFCTSKGTTRIGDMRDSAICDRHCRIFVVPQDNGIGNDVAAGLMGAGGGLGVSNTSLHNSPFFNDIVTTVGDIKFDLLNDRRFITRDYLNLYVWDMAMNTEPIKTVPIHPAIKDRLCDFYENDAIFDKFDCGISFDGQHALTGTYNNMIRITNINSDGNGMQDDEIIQADKNLLKTSSSSSLNLFPNSTRSMIGSPFSSKGGNGGIGKLLSSPSLTKDANDSNRLDELMQLDIDLDKKIQYTSVHPKENTIAIAAASNLFIFSQNS